LVKPMSMAKSNNPRIHNSRRYQTVGLCIVFAIIALFFITRYMPVPSSPYLIEGLSSPRGLTPLENGSLLVAEGGVGRLLFINEQGHSEVLYEGIPHLSNGPEGVPVGVSAAIQHNEIYYYAVGEARAKEFREIYSLVPGHTPQPLTGQDPIGISPPNPLTNPYDLLSMNSGELLVSDSGANVIWLVSFSGQIRLYATIDSIDYPTDMGREQTQAVPTGLSYGPDGAIYVATLTGYPFPKQMANIMRLNDDNRDGDALDPGETSIYAQGFSAATDVTFDAKGRMFVTEYSQSMLELSEIGFQESHLFPGRLLLWDAGKVTVIASDLVSPTALALMGSHIYVSEEFAGRIRMIEIEPMQSNP
jgi:hypothetical protein